MAKTNTKDGIEVIPEGDPRNEWPKTAKAQAISGLSMRALENAVRTGAVAYVYDQSKDRHFDPDSLAELSGIVDEKVSANELASEVITELRKMNTALVNTTKDLLKLATEPAFRSYRMVSHENISIRRHNRKLERKHMKMLDAFEAALTAAHDRELAAKKASGEQARLDKAFDMAMGQLPNIIAGIGSKKSLDKLFSTFTSEQLEVLLELVTPEQKTIILNLMKHRGSGANGVSARSPAGSQTDSDNKQESNPEKPS